MYILDQIDKTEYPRVVDLWEASVRATHHFLPESDIQYFKPLILNEYLDAVTLSCIRDDHQEIMGFMGVSDDNIEMLFIHPDHFKKGLGKAFIHHATQDLNIRKVEVNEQNPGAVEFYKKLGFTVVKRTDTDHLGKPYPILYLELEG